MTISPTILPASQPHFKKVDIYQALCVLADYGRHLKQARNQYMILMDNEKKANTVSSSYSVTLNESVLLLFLWFNVLLLISSFTNSESDQLFLLLTCVVPFTLLIVKFLIHFDYLYYDIHHFDWDSLSSLIVLWDWIFLLITVYDSLFWINTVWEPQLRLITLWYSSFGLIIIWNKQVGLVIYTWI